MNTPVNLPLCKNCKKSAKSDVALPMPSLICTEPKIQDWEVFMRTDYVHGKITPIYCDAARRSPLLCGHEGRHYEVHTEESRKVWEIVNSYEPVNSPTVQSLSGKETLRVEDSDKEGP